MKTCDGVLTTHTYRALKDRVKADKDDKTVRDLVVLLYETSLLAAGELPTDPRALGERMFGALALLSPPPPLADDASAERPSPSIDIDYPPLTEDAKRRACVLPDEDGNVVRTNANRTIILHL